MENELNEILEKVQDWPAEDLRILYDAIITFHKIALKREGYEHKNDILLLANADYESRCTEEYTPSIRATERWFKLKAGSLIYFRANKNRRTNGKVEIVGRLGKIK